MPHVWIAGPNGAGWRTEEMRGELVALATLSGPQGAGRSAASSVAASSAVLARGAVGGESWVLFAGGHGVVLNGEPLLAGARVLAHRDEIRIGGDLRIYFSSERRARVERFAGADRPIRCPRCDSAIAPGDLVVRCPRDGCGLLHHHAASAAPSPEAVAAPPDLDAPRADEATAEDLLAGDPDESCWLCAETCAGCRLEPSAAQATPRWTPEGV